MSNIYIFFYKYIDTIIEMIRKLPDKHIYPQIIFCTN